MVDVRPFRALRPAPGSRSGWCRRRTTWSTSRRRGRTPAAIPTRSCGCRGRRSTCAADVDPHSDEVYALGRANLDDFVARGVLVRDERADVLGLPPGDGRRACRPASWPRSSVDDYDAGRVRIHEHTRPDKEDDRVRHIDALDAQDEPVFLLVAPLGRRRRDRRARSTSREPRGRPRRARRRRAHAVGRRRPGGGRRRCTARSSEAGDLYVADGHHRSAAASRVHARAAGTAGDARRASSPSSSRSTTCTSWPTTAWSPTSRGRSVEELLVGARRGGLRRRRAAYGRGDAVGGRTSSACTSTATGSSRRARRRRRRVRPARRGSTCRCCRTGCSRPLLGIGDPRTDSRIAFVGGIRGAERDRAPRRRRARTPWASRCSRPRPPSSSRWPTPARSCRRSRRGSSPSSRAGCSCTRCD